jgi:hypothetical protein
MDVSAAVGMTTPTSMPTSMSMEKSAAAVVDTIMTTITSMTMKKNVAAVVDMTMTMRNKRSRYIAENAMYTW